MFHLHDIIHHQHAAKHAANHIDMLHGSLLPKILLFALPLSLSSMLQQAFNSVDVAVVGKFVSSQAMAAVGGNGPIINLLINLFVGISVGADVVIARYIGQKADEKVKETVKTSQVLSIISGFLLMFIGMFAARPMLEAIGTPSDILTLATSYLRVYFLGMPAFMFFNFGAAILRSVGDTKRPLISLLFGSILNAILNCIFVVAFDWGVYGVAIATVISNYICAAMVAYWLATEDEPIRWTFRQLGIERGVLAQTLQIGIPAGLQGMVFSFSNIFIQAAINTHGSAAVAGSAAAVVYECLAWLAVSGFTQAAVTFTSQNYGAHHYDRCKKILVLCSSSSFALCAVFAGVFVGAQGFFIELFTDDPSVTHYASTRLIWVLLLEPIAVSYELPGASMRGLGYSMTPTIITVLGTCAFRLLWIYTVCPIYPSYEALMVVYPISWVITGVATIIAYRIVSKKAYRMLPSPAEAAPPCKCLA